MKFSILMSTYAKENPEYLSAALESLRTQTVPADEIVIIKDGKLTVELDKVINDYAGMMPVKVIALDNNVGLGKALQIGVNECSYEYIARMDSDDICREDRFEKQIKFLEDNPDIDVVGSWINEFEGYPENIYSHRRLPFKSDELLQFAKKRSPLNHVTVLFKKDAVLKAGNYYDIKFSQDYHLWIRMLLNNAKFANIPEYLVNVRAGRDMVARRGGMKYAKNEYRLQKEFYDMGFLTYAEFLRNIAVRIPVRLMPGFLRKAVYALFRKS